MTNYFLALRPLLLSSFFSSLSLLCMGSWALFFHVVVRWVLLPFWVLMPSALGSSASCRFYRCSVRVHFFWVLLPCLFAASTTLLRVGLVRCTLVHSQRRTHCCCRSVSQCLSRPMYMLMCFFSPGAAQTFFCTFRASSFFWLCMCVYNLTSLA